MKITRFITRFKQTDPRSAGYLSNARVLGFHNLKRIECQDLYFIESQLSQEDLQQLALKLLTDPVTQTVTWDELPASQLDPEPKSVILDVALRPGVTDSVAEQIVRAAHELRLEGVRRAATGQRFIVEGLKVEETGLLAKQLLVNDVIQRWKIGNIEPSFPEEVESSGTVETISIRTLICRLRRAPSPGTADRAAAGSLPRGR